MKRALFIGIAILWMVEGCGVGASNSFKGPSTPAFLAQGANPGTVAIGPGMVASLAPANFDPSAGPCGSSLGSTTPPALVAFSENGQVSLNWSTTGDSYKIFRSTSSGLLNTKTVLVSFTTTTSYIDTPLVNGTTYYYQVTATHNGYCESAGSNEVAATPAPSPPPAPTGLTATPGNALVLLAWSVVPGTDHYDIYRWIPPANPARIATGLTVTQYADLGVRNGPQYCYYVTARNFNGESPPSPTACATPSGGGPNNATLTVTVVAKNINQPIAGFTVSLGSSGTNSQITNASGQAVFASSPGPQDVHVFSGQNCANVSIMSFSNANLTVPIYCTYNDPDHFAPLFTASFAGNITGLSSTGDNVTIGATSNSDTQICLTGGPNSPTCPNNLSYTLQINSDNLSPYTLYAFENNGNQCNPYVNSFSAQFPSVGINTMLAQDIQFSTTPGFSTTIAGNITLPQSVANKTPGYAFRVESFQRLGDQGQIFPTGKCYLDAAPLSYSLTAFFSPTTSISGTVAYGVSAYVTTTTYATTFATGTTSTSNITLAKLYSQTGNYPNLLDLNFLDVAGNVTPNPTQRMMTWTAPSTGNPSFYHLILLPSPSAQVSLTSGAFQQWEFFLPGTATSLTLPSIPSNAPAGAFTIIPGSGSNLDLFHYSYTFNKTPAPQFDYNNASWTLDFSNQSPLIVDSAVISFQDFYTP